MISLEVVINTWFGGFSLSDLAIKRLKELGYQGKEYDNGFYSIERHDPLLIQVVKELGDKANGSHARLKIETIEWSYSISDYDGKEEIIW